MQVFSSRSLRLTLVSFFATLLFAGSALASAPSFDNGSQISTDSPYQNAQKITGDIFTNRSIYGKLEGDTPIDIYSFTPAKDGDIQVSLMLRVAGKLSAADTANLPVLILVDPTSATSSDPIDLPTPSSDYHLALVHQEDGTATTTEPVLLQKYAIVGQQVLSLQKGKTYYFVVAPSSSSASSSPYIIKFGNGKSWTVKDFFSSFGGWMRIQSNDFAGSSPFTFTVGTFGLLMLLLGLTLLIGMVLVQELFSLRANKSKSAGYLLIKLQPYSRVTIWISSWLLILGEYVLFHREGWGGIPFILVLLTIPIVINMLFVTFKLSNQIRNLEVSKKEATIPFSMRKRWFFSTLVSLFSFGAYVTYLAVYLLASR